ncbi:acetyltransferase [Paenibacillus sp. 32O-W]|uniref:GNAT family N-acetyltransferase n=1 Tax=Paenibacillus sp. 32O-W TaxID=1695218 RepID=UPI0007210F1A|nr:GNAT family N-acetyltransferase [Paenibacillus sp. 32O-W]ALS25691.1 acetyltransferase [Paenibacillus sp. 32O-W]
MKPNQNRGRLSGVWSFIPMTEEHARALCEWRYEPPYDLFQFDDWQEMQAQGIEFGDPEIRARQYAAVLDREGELAGFAQFFPLLGVTRLGLGLRPDRCGRGEGPGFVRAIAEEALRRAPGDTVDLEVLTWNERAIRAYEKAGFVITDTYVRATPTGDAEFHCMVYQPQKRQPQRPDRSSL